MQKGNPCFAVWRKPIPFSLPTQGASETGSRSPPPAPCTDHTGGLQDLANFRASLMMFLTAFWISSSSFSTISCNSSNLFKYCYLQLSLEESQTLAGQLLHNFNQTRRKKKMLYAKSGNDLMLMTRRASLWGLGRSCLLPTYMKQAEVLSCLHIPSFCFQWWSSAADLHGRKQSQLNLFPERSVTRGREARQQEQDHVFQ